MGINPNLSEGDVAPLFRADAVDGDGNTMTLDLEALRGQRVLLYFYPKDDTPGCTTQACDFRDNMVALQGAGLQVVGVSPDGVDSHVAFQNKYNLTFPLVADADHAIATAYGVWREKKNYGRTYTGIVRSTFVIEPDGTLSTIFDNVRAKGHVARLVKTLA